MIKVLIIGLGSIGKRHTDALLALGVNNIAALRTGKGLLKLDISYEKKLLMFYSDDEAFSWKPTHVIISNPTSLHTHYIKKALSIDSKIFVEKPIAGKIEDVQNLPENINAIVGYNLRFHGLFQIIKKVIQSQQFGKVLMGQLHVGQYLPNWHPYEDYRLAYYSRKDLGGGALRTLSHEIDLAQFFFGKIKSLTARVQKLSNLAIDVDDQADIWMEMSNCKHLSIHINYLDPVLTRKGSIYFEKGLLQYDFIRSELIFTNNKREKKELYMHKEDYNQQYIEQMKEFMENEKPHFGCTFEQGIATMKAIEKSEESSKVNKRICLV